jgi:hypothetical protein
MLRAIGRRLAFALFLLVSVGLGLEAGVRLLDTGNGPKPRHEAPGLRERAGENAWGERDRHFNARGHQLWFEILRYRVRRLLATPLD